MIKVYMGIPSTGQRTDAQNHALRIIEKKYRDQVELVYPAECVYRMFHDYARCEVVKDFLKTDCDILWFLDSDIVPHEDVLNLVTEHGDKWKLAGAPYPVFMTIPNTPCPSVVFTVYDRDETGRFSSANVPKEGTDFVAGIATGCLFIKREILAAMSEPYFEFKYDEKTRNILEGEDLGFCRKMSDLGHKFFINYEYVCRHLKQVDLLDVNNYAIMYAQDQLVAFERGLRQAIARKKLASTPAKSRLILP